MKHLLFILGLTCLSFLGVEAQVLWPSGNATTFTVANTGTTSVTVSNNMTYVASVPTLTANATLSLTAGTRLKAGAMVLVAVKTTSTETTTFVGQALAPVVTGVAGKTWSQAFIYNGSYFYPCGAKIQVD